MKFYSALVLLACLVLASCQSMSKEECAVADWSVIGEQDGAAGYNPQDRFARHVKACAKAGIAARASPMAMSAPPILKRASVKATILAGYIMARNGR